MAMAENLKQKLDDLELTGCQVEFTPEEADELGLTIDDSMSFEDALAGVE